MFSPSGLIGVIWKVRLILAEEILTLISVDQLLTCLREGPLEIQKSPELDSTLLPFIFLSSKTTADGGRSHEIKRRLLLGRRVMTNPDSILKSRDIILPTNVHLVKAMVFPVVMYGCESWTIKKAEH